MNEEQMRKEFEEFVVGMKDSHNIPYHLDRDEDDYVYKNTYDLWTGFKLAHQAMKPIKLPLLMKNTQEQACYYYNDAIYECKEAIEQAGYKAEP